jgi:hypothetical protein
VLDAAASPVRHLGHQPGQGCRCRQACPTRDFADAGDRAARRAASTTWDLSPARRCATSRRHGVHRSCTNARIEDLRAAARCCGPAQGRRLRCGWCPARGRCAQAEAEGLDQVSRRRASGGVRGGSMCLGMNPTSWRPVSAAPRRPTGTSRGGRARAARPPRVTAGAGPRPRSAPPPPPPPPPGALEPADLERSARPPARRRLTAG